MRDAMRGAGLAAPPRSSQDGLRVTVALAAPALLFAVLPGAAAWATYDRGRIAAGEWWRLVTGHWAHWSIDHLAWDLLAFAVLVPFCLRVAGSRLLPTLAIACGLISTGLWIAYPNMVAYRGLSGLDSALFALLAATLVREAFAEKDRALLAAVGVGIAAFAAKLAVEILTGSTVFDTGATYTPVPLAHVLGALAGVLAAPWRPPARSLSE